MHDGFHFQSQSPLVGSIDIPWSIGRQRSWAAADPTLDPSRAQNSQSHCCLFHGRPMSLGGIWSLGRGESRTPGAIVGESVGLQLPVQVQLQLRPSWVCAGASEVPVKCVEFPANRGGPHRIRSMSCSVRVRAAPLCWAYLSYLLGSYSYRKRQGLITNWRVFLFSMCGETGKQYGLGRSQVSALSAYLGITAFEFVERVQEIGNLKTNTAGLG